MIEIVEVKETSKRAQLGVIDESDRLFVFLERNEPLGIIQFSVRPPQLAKLLVLEVNHHTSLDADLIVDGLVRTACHTFQKEKIDWIVTEKEMVYKNNHLPDFFTPWTDVRDAMPHEIVLEIFTLHPNDYVMKTDMIYKGCCKGD